MTKRRISLVIALMLSIAGAAAADTLAAGVWSKKSFAIAGGWSIVEEDGERWIVLDEAFETRKAPDLKLFLSKQPLGEATGRNATRGAVLIAPLDSAKGGQRYRIPAGVELADYTTLLLHCEKYAKLWGGTSLR